MKYIDRVALGKKFAQLLDRYKSKDVVLICLKESSLLTTITLASEIRAWIYPLIYTPVMSTDSLHGILGAVDENGSFCPYNTDEANYIDDPDIQAQIDLAQKNNQQLLSEYGMELDKNIMNGRDVICVGDVLNTSLPVLLAARLLNGVQSKSVSAICGNATTEAFDALRINIDNIIVLDVLANISNNDNSYFEQLDQYTTNEKYDLTRHIASYWE